MTFELAWQIAHTRVREFHSISNCKSNREVEAPSVHLFINLPAATETLASLSGVLRGLGDREITSSRIARATSEKEQRRESRSRQVPHEGPRRRKKRHADSHIVRGLRVVHAIAATRIYFYLNPPPSPLSLLVSVFPLEVRSEEAALILLLCRSPLSASPSAPPSPLSLN